MCWSANSGHIWETVSAEHYEISSSQGSLVSLRKIKSFRLARIDYQVSAKGIILGSSPGVGSFHLAVDCQVRDTALPATEPASSRTAQTVVQFTGDRVIYDQSYRDDAERCWWTRTQVPQPVRDWPPRLGEFLPWVDPLDKHAISNLMQRLRFRGMDFGPRPEEFRPKGER